MVAKAGRGDRPTPSTDGGEAGPNEVAPNSVPPAPPGQGCGALAPVGGGMAAGGGGFPPGTVEGAEAEGSPELIGRWG